MAFAEGEAIGGSPGAMPSSLSVFHCDGSDCAAGVDEAAGAGVLSDASSSLPTIFADESPTSLSVAKTEEPFTVTNVPPCASQFLSVVTPRDPKRDMYLPGEPFGKIRMLKSLRVFAFTEFIEIAVNFTPYRSSVHQIEPNEV